MAKEFILNTSDFRCSKVKVEMRNDDNESKILTFKKTTRTKAVIQAKKKLNKSWSPFRTTCVV